MGLFDFSHAQRGSALPSEGPSVQSGTASAPEAEHDQGTAQTETGDDERSGRRQP
jgi:hypothetical protein